ncbi:MAG: polysaccharide biosynthesis protein [Nitrospira sp.]|nr:polysaccharide biosynthesis protein [Nitrospira sp.]
MKHIIAQFFHAVADQYGSTVLRYRSSLVIGVQLVLILAANLTAFVLRFDADIPPEFEQVMWDHIPAVLLIFGFGLWLFGTQRGLWRYVGLHDIGKILLASLTSVGCFYVILHVVGGVVRYPRSVIILTGLLNALYLVGIRLAVRWFKEWLRIVGPTARRALIVGAGNAGEMLVRDMLSGGGYDCRPVGFLDDDPVKRKMRIHGIPVVGTIATIKQAADTFAANEIIIAIPSASTTVMQKVLTASEGCTIPIKTLPSVKRLLDDPVSLRQVRPMNLDDLLQREPVETDRQELTPLIMGKTLLVTGAGGSIGSELCRQIAQHSPRLLVLFERYENALHSLMLELGVAFPEVRILPVIGDVTVSDRVDEIFQQTTPHIVFHAAAHKHVPLMELNPKEAIRNNVLGTRTVAEAAVRNGAERFVLISTDKAVNPSSIMGATKRVAEHLMQEFNQEGLTKFTVVRFGNVLGSNGSVVPLFYEQIRRGGPVTVTHPEIKRFFMTIPEAVQLVLQASVIGKGGEVFVLDMGEQIRVADLARNMIVLAGLVPGKDIEIVFAGLRPGEKLYEELFEEHEQAEPTSHPKIRRAVGAPVPVGELGAWLESLQENLPKWSEARVLDDLRRLVPSYESVLVRRTS